MKGQLSRVLLCIALLTPALAPRLAVAAEKNAFVQDRKNDLEFHGSITAIDTNAVTVTVKNKEKGALTFTVTKDSLLFVKQKKGAATLADFKVGDEVNALYRQNGTALTCDSLWHPGSSPREKEHKIEKQGQ